MGCLIFASIGLLVGLFIAIVSGSPANPWIGLTIIVICAIPWVRFFIKGGQPQQVQEPLGQTPTAQPKQQATHGSQSAFYLRPTPDGGSICPYCSATNGPTRRICAACGAPLPMVEPVPEPEQEELQEFPPRRQPPQAEQGGNQQKRRWILDE